MPASAPVLSPVTVLRLVIILTVLAVWEFLSHSGWLYRDVVPSLLAIHSLWRRPTICMSSALVFRHNRFRSLGHSPSNRLAGICVYFGSSRMRRSASPDSLARVAGPRVRPWKSCLARRSQRGTGKRLCVYWINRKNCPRIRPTDSLRVRIVLRRRCNDAGQGSGA